jgi:hypothetical protein
MRVENAVLKRDSEGFAIHDYWIRGVDGKKVCTCEQYLMWHDHLAGGQVPSHQGRHSQHSLHTACSHSLHLLQATPQLQHARHLVHTCNCMTKR